MAIIIDPSESRDRRIKMLLDTATQAAQIQNQKTQLAQQQQEAQAASQLGYARLGYRPIDSKLATSPGGRLPSKMTTGPYGQAYVPSPQMQSMVPQYVFDPNTGEYTQTGVAPKGSQIRSKVMSADTVAAREGAKQGEAQKYFKEPEIQDIRDISDTRDTLKEVRSGLEQLGIKDPSKYGTVEMETIDSNFGPISVPARFNLVGQYAKDPKYTSVKQKLERAFNKYRKIITGAQASNQELQTLRQSFARFTDRPEVFFENLSTLEDETDRMLNTRFDLYDAVGRDTNKLRGLYQTKQAKELDSFSKDAGVPKEVMQQIQGMGKIKSIKKVK